MGRTAARRSLNSSIPAVHRCQRSQISNGLWILVNERGRFGQVLLKAFIWTTIRLRKVIFYQSNSTPAMRWLWRKIPEVERGWSAFPQQIYIGSSVALSYTISYQRLQPQNVHFWGICGKFLFISTSAFEHSTLDSFFWFGVHFTLETPMELRDRKSRASLEMKEFRWRPQARHRSAGSPLTQRSNWKFYHQTLKSKISYAFNYHSQSSNARRFCGNALKLICESTKWQYREFEERICHQILNNTPATSQQAPESSGQRNQCNGHLDGRSRRGRRLISHPATNINWKLGCAFLHCFKSVIAATERALLKHLLQIFPCFMGPLFSIQ
jgi:hypothetical protein